MSVAKEKKDFEKQAGRAKAARKVQSLGTKASGTTWVAQLTITLS
jgi:hypothetical protein